MLATNGTLKIKSVSLSVLKDILGQNQRAREYAKKASSMKMELAILFALREQSTEKDNAFLSVLLELLGLMVLAMLSVTAMSTGMPI